jgi:acyl carrier protein
MTRADFMPQLADTLEAEPESFSEATILEQMRNWDSMKLLEIIALVDEQLDMNLNADALARCETAGQICDLIGERLSR